MTSSDEALAWARSNAPDCGDNSCLFGGRGKGGMRTNGGCRCFKDLPTMRRIYVERLYNALLASPPQSATEAIPKDVLATLRQARAEGWYEDNRGWDKIDAWLAAPANSTKGEV